MNIQIKRPISNVITAEHKNKIQFERAGKIIYFKINFNPSANACKNPQKPITFGPVIRCIEAIVLSSAIVKKATDNKVLIIVIKAISIFIF